MTPIHLAAAIIVLALLAYLFAALLKPEAF